MNLDLDSRQRAMLAEMGVHVWWPASAAMDDVAPAPAAGPHPPDVEVATRQPMPTQTTPVEPIPTQTQRPAAPARRTVAVRGPAPTVVTSLAASIDQMDWPELQATVAACQACSMCLGRRTPVLAAPDAPLRADWLVLGEPPDDAQERAGEPFVDDAGLLLDNMLKAVGVRRYRPADGADPAHTAYLSLVLKCRPALPTAPDAQALAACAHYLRREMALVQPKVILAMGRLAMQVLLSEDHPQGLKLPLGKLRGQVWHYQGVPVVVTYPSAYLLRNAPDKARAWEDLCLAADVALGARPDPTPVS